MGGDTEQLETGPLRASCETSTETSTAGSCDIRRWDLRPSQTCANQTPTGSLPASESRNRSGLQDRKSSCLRSTAVFASTLIGWTN